MTDWRPESEAPRDGSWIVSSGPYGRRLRWACHAGFHWAMPGCAMWAWTDEAGRYGWHVNEWKPA